jgi:hypothetical protein
MDEGSLIAIPVEDMRGNEEPLTIIGKLPSFTLYGDVSKQRSDVNRAYH